MNAGTLVRVSFPSVESHHHPMRDTHRIGCTPGLRTITGVALGTEPHKMYPFYPPNYPPSGDYTTATGSVTINAAPGASGVFQEGWSSYCETEVSHGKATWTR
jgi:hypothetical protein